MNRLTQTIVLVLIGLGLSAAIGLLSVLMTGGGDGWCSSISSGLCILFLPAMGYPFVFAHRRFSIYVACYVSLGCLGLDAVLVTMTALEGWFHVERVWNVIPYFTLSWAALWFTWHVLIALLWIRLMRAVCSGEHESVELTG